MGRKYAREGFGRRFEPLFVSRASILVALAIRSTDLRSPLRLVGPGGAGNVSSDRGLSGERLLSHAEEPREAGRDDAELVALARAYDQAAFEALYRRHSPYALALAVRVQGSAQDIEDIVHDSFLKAHDRMADLRSGSSFRAWLSSIVVSQVRTRMRRRRMLGLLGLSTADPIDLDALVSPQAGPEVRAQLAQVYQILCEVSVDERICWTLRYVEGRKLEDVAEFAGCSLATAKRRISSVQVKILGLESAPSGGTGEGS